MNKRWTSSGIFVFFQLMKAIVIGATGLVGHQLVQLLLADQQYTRVLVLHRRATGLTNEKLQEEIVDFDEPEQWKHLVQGDVLFSAMGTTLKQAGSKEAQYKVDHTYQYQVAAAAAQNEVSKYVLVSAGMASVNSLFFYSRIKGELERAVRQLPFQHIHIVRPGLLTGARNEKRPAEEWSAHVMKVVSGIPGLGTLRPITGSQVAGAMIWVARQVAEPVQIHPAGRLFAYAHQYETKLER